MRNRVQQAITNKALQDVAQHRAGLKQAMELKYATLVDGSWQPTQSEWDTHVQKQLSLGLEPEYGNKMLKIKIASQTKAIEEAAIKRLQIKADKGTLTMQDIKSEKNINAGKQFEVVAQDLDDYKKDEGNNWKRKMAAIENKVGTMEKQESYVPGSLTIQGQDASDLIQGYARRLLGVKLAEKRAQGDQWNPQRNISQEISVEVQEFMDRETFGVEDGEGSLGIKRDDQGVVTYPNLTTSSYNLTLKLLSNDPVHIKNSYETRVRHQPDKELRWQQPDGIATNAELEEFVTTGVLPESLKYTIKMEGFPNGADDAIDKAVKAKLKSGDAATKALLKRLNLTKYKGEKQGVSISEIINKHLASAKISANDTHKLKTIQYVIRHIGWDALTPPQKETILKIGGTDLKEGALRDDYHEHLKIQGNIKKNETLKNTLSPADYFGTGEGFQGFIQDTN